MIMGAVFGRSLIHIERLSRVAVSQPKVNPVRVRRASLPPMRCISSFQLMRTPRMSLGPPLREKINVKPIFVRRQHSFSVVRQEPGSYLSLIAATCAITLGLCYSSIAEAAGDEDLPLSEEEWKKLASHLKIEPDSETMKEKCFEMAYQACLQGEWSQIDAALPLIKRLKDAWGRSLLAYAVEMPHLHQIKVVQNLLQRGVGITSCDQEGNTPLHYAAGEGALLLIEPLWKAGMSFDTRNKVGETPLHVAIRRGEDQVVQVLAKNGANLSLKINEEDVGPLELSIIYGRKECLDVLLTKIDLPPSTNTRNLLHWAIRTGQWQMLDHLLTTHFEKMKPFIDSGDEKGLSPFCFAAFCGDVEALKLLHDKGANKMTKDPLGRDPVHFAVLGHHPHVLEWLASYEWPLDERDRDWKCPQDLLADGDPLKGILRNLILQKRERRPFDPKQYPPENLIFQGGGPKGIAYVGVLEELERRGALGDIKRIAGTSAGAITAVLVALGCTSQELNGVLDRLVLKDFLDHAAKIPSSEEKKYQAMVKKLLHGLTHPLQVLKEMRALGTGICPGDTFRKWIESRIQEKTGIPNCTFGELKRLIETTPRGFKHIYLFGTKIGPGDPEIQRFSTEDPACDKMVISHAVRISMSIPGAFRPHQIHMKDSQSTAPYPRPDLGHFWDGGILFNLPLKTFDKKQYAGGPVPDRSLQDPFINPRTWVFSLIDPKDAKASSDDQPGLLNLISKIIDIYYHAEAILRKQENQGLSRVVLINNLGLSTLNFNLDQKTKDQLRANGRTATAEFLADWKTGQIGVTGLFYDSVVYSQKIRRHLLHLPVLSPFFMFRNDEIAGLEKALCNHSQKNETTVHCVAGPSGVGKTELVNAFCRSQMKKFSLIWMIDCSTPEKEAEDYRSLAQALSLEVDKKGGSPAPLHEVKKKVHGVLETKDFEKPWLLVLDNCEAFPNSLPTRGGSMIITTTNPTLGIGRNTLPLSPFSEEEAVNHLRAITGEPLNAEMKKLVHALDRLPQLIDCAAHYIKETPGCSSKDYLTSFQELPKQGIFDLERRDLLPENLVRTTRLTLEKLPKNAKDFLFICAFLNSKNIPETLISDWIEREMPTANSTQRRAIKDEIFRALYRTGRILYDSQNKCFSIHDSLKRSLLSLLSQNPHADLPSKAIHLLYSLLTVARYNPTKPHTTLAFHPFSPHCSNTLMAAQFFPLNNKREFTLLCLTEIRYLLESTRELDRAREFLAIAEKQTTLDSSLQGRIHFYRGMLHRMYSIGQQKQEAIKSFREALNCFSLAQVCFQKDTDATHYQEIEENPEKCHQPYQIAIALQYQGETLVDLDDFDNAERKFQEAEETLKAFLKGKEHFDLARITRERGRILYRRGRLSDALNKVKEAIEMQKRVYRDHYPYQSTVGATHVLLGEIYAALKDFKGAKTAFEFALETNEKAYGTKDHSHNIRIYAHLSALYAAFGQPDQAAKMKAEQERLEKLTKASP